MSDSDTPNGHLIYWDQYEKMTFAELRGLIDDALGKLSDPAAEAAFPRSKEEFEKLVGMLEAKLEPLKQGAPTPTPAPLMDLETPMRPWFEPSEALDSLYERRERLSGVWNEARRDPSPSKHYIDQIERDLRDLEREIELREIGEKEEYEKRLEEYEQEMEEYREAREARAKIARLRRDEARRNEERRRSLEIRTQIVRRVRRDVKRAFRNRPTGYIHWEPLQPGKVATPSDIRQHYIRQHYERMQREGRIDRDRFDQERLEKACALPYEEWLAPTSGLEAYSVFKFSHTPKVLLECPLYANAAYVVESDDDCWLRETSKQELLESGKAKKIPHRGENWDEQIKQALDLPEEG